MTVRLKPNGRARIIMDLSYPQGETLGKGMVCSPNVVMSNYDEFEPVKMKGDVQWRRCMYRAGRQAGRDDKGRLGHGLQACLSPLGGPQAPGGFVEGSS